MATVTDCLDLHRSRLLAAGVDVKALADRAFEIRQLDGVEPGQAARDAVEEQLAELERELAQLRLMSQPITLYQDVLPETPEQEAQALVRAQELLAAIPPDAAGVTSLSLLADPVALEAARQSVLAIATARTESGKRVVVKTIDVAQFLQARSIEALGGQSRTEFEAANAERISDAMAAETAWLMSRPGSGTDWYKLAIERTHRVAALAYPEIQTDPMAKSAFNYALAVTSNGQDVLVNVRDAMRVYGEYRASGSDSVSRTMPDFGVGERDAQMKQAFALWNLSVQTYGIETWVRFLNSDFRVGQLKSMGYEVSSELVDTIVPGSVILGPKIGGAFFANLQANYDVVTMDLWWTRSWGRYTGDIVETDEAKLGKLRATFLAAVTDEELTAAGIGNNVLGGVRAGDPELVDEAAALIHRYWMKSSGYEGTYVKALNTPGRRAGRQLDKAVSMPKAAPESGAHRAFMRTAASRAVEKLRGLGLETDVSDTQAVLWYGEKELYAALGAPETNREDFAGGAAKVLLEGGEIDAQDIEAALRDPGGSGGRGGRRGATQSGQGEVPGRTGGTFSKPESRNFVAWRIGQQLLQRIRPTVSWNESGPYRRGASGARRYNLSERAKGLLGTTKTTWSLPYTYRYKLISQKVAELGGVVPANLITSTGATTTDILELEPSAEAGAMFHDFIQSAADSHPQGTSVQVKEPAEYAKLRLFVSDDGQVGFALDGDNIVSVYNTAGSPHRSVGQQMMMLAVQAGGRRLDAFDGYLPFLYSTVGFEATSRVPWNDSYSPEGWDYSWYASRNPWTQGRPDVVMMAYTPGSSVYQIGDASSDTYAEWDDAESVQIDAVDRIAQGETTLYQSDETLYQVAEPARVPQKTVRAFKLFRVNPRDPGKLFPLYVRAGEPVPIGVWVAAQAGEPAAGGGVQSTLGPLAYRPGWHAGDAPAALHIGQKAEGAQRGAKPAFRRASEVWAEVEMSADVDWQAEANRRADRTKGGRVIPRSAHITDQVPVGGHYRYRTNPNMQGEWLIGGEMRIVRVLSDAEVAAINAQHGVSDLPRVEGDRVSQEMANGYRPTVLSQDRPSGPRGSITLPAGGLDSGPALIRLFERRDLSTLLHEASHFFLESYRHLVDTGQANERQAVDYQTLLGWLGTDTIGVESQERFARAFELWLREGRAPSLELEGTFRRFRGWLMQIYRTIRSRYFSDIELTDEVREVFARMLATDDQIQAVEQYFHYEPLFDEAMRANMTKGEADAYLRALSRASQEHRAALEQKLLAELQRQQTDARQAHEKALREAFAKEVDQDPAYQAWEYLRTGKTGRADLADTPAMKLSKSGLEDIVGSALPMWAPRLRGLYRVNGGIHPDAVAEIFGLDSGEQLVQFIASNPSRAELIESRVQAQIRAEFGDSMTDGSLEQTAFDLAHNDARLRVLEREMTVLARTTGGESLSRRTGRLMAERALGQRTVRMASQTSKYAAAEARAARAAERALLAGRPEEASSAKRQQLIQHHLYKASAAAREEVEKALRYFRRFDNRQSRGGIDPRYLVQIDSMLEDVDLKRRSLKTLAERKSLRDFIAEQTSLGEEINVSDRLQQDAALQHYTEMRLDDFRALVDAVKNLEHVGRELAANDTRLEEMVRDITESIDTSGITRNPIRPPFTRTMRDRFAKAFRSLDAIHLKPEFVFEHLDGDRAGGPVWTHLFKPVADAETAEVLMQEQAVLAQKQAFDQLSDYDRKRLYDKIHLDGLGTMSRSTLLSIALNWGNEYNRRAVVEGYAHLGWTEDNITAALGRLTSSDWAFVEAVWAHIDSYWPLISTMQRELTGTVPEKVSAEPFAIGNRIIRGGYYPLAFDSEGSYRVFQREEHRTVQEQYGGNYARATTRQGHTKERTYSAGLPVRLDLSVYSQHVNNVIHDLTHRRAIRDVDRLLRDSRVRGAIEETVGTEFYRQLKPWLSSIASDQIDPSHALDKIIGHVRKGATIVNMGLKITTAIVQPLGYLQSIDMIGEKWAAVGLWKTYGNPLQFPRRVRWVLEKSTMMRNRQATFDRDVRDQLKRLGGRKGLWHQSQAQFFRFIGLMDMSVSIPTWIGAYEKGMEDFRGNDEQAVDYADRTVRMSQSAGAAKDLATVQRGTETQRLFVMFYSYFSALYNLMRRRGQMTHGVTDAFRMGASLAYLVFLPAILSELITQRGPDDDDPDEWAKWVATKAGAYPFQSVVLVRDVVNAMTSNYGFDLSPAADAFDTTQRAGRKLAQVAFGDAEWDRALSRDVVMTVGYWGHLPSRQLWLTGEYLYDWKEGNLNSYSPWEMLVTGTRGDRKE